MPQKCGQGQWTLHKPPFVDYCLQVLLRLVSQDSHVTAPGNISVVCPTHQPGISAGDPGLLFQELLGAKLPLLCSLGGGGGWIVGGALVGPIPVWIPEPLTHHSLSLHLVGHSVIRQTHGEPITSRRGNRNWETSPPGRQTGKCPTVSPALGLTHRHTRRGAQLPGVGGMQNLGGFLGDSVPQTSRKRSGHTPGREGGRVGSWALPAEAAVGAEAPGWKS